MDYELTSEEKETIINFDEKWHTASVFTYNKKLIKRLSEVIERNPSKAKLIRTNKAGGYEYEIDKKLVAIKLPPTAENLKRLKENGKRLSEGREISVQAI